MVGHQYISVDLAIIFARCVNQAIEVEAIVLLGKEGRLTVIAPLDNVLRHVREIQPVSSWHGSSSFSCGSFPPSTHAPRKSYTIYSRTTPERICRSYSSLILVASITFAHFFNSSGTRRRNSSPEVSAGSNPSVANCSLTSGMAMTFRTAS